MKPSHSEFVRSAGPAAALVLGLLASGCAGPSVDRDARASEGLVRPGHAVVVATRGHAEVTQPNRGGLRSDRRRELAGFRENHAVVRAVRGQAEYLPWNAARWEKLKVGMMLTVGSGVRTGPDSEVDLFLKQNGPVVRLVPDSELRLQELYYRERPEGTVIITVLEVPRGNILSNVKKLAPESRYEIRTPEGITRVRGTILNVAYDGWISVVEGRVEFLTPAGRFTIGPGQTFDPNRGIVRPSTAGEQDWAVGLEMPAGASGQAETPPGSVPSRR